MKKQNTSPVKKIVVSLAALLSVFALGYFVTTQLFNVDPNAAFGRATTKFALPTTFIIDNSVPEICGSVKEYKVTAYVYKEVGKRIIGSTSKTVPLETNEFEPMVLDFKVANRDRDEIANSVGDSYYRAYYTIQAYDLNGRMIAKKQNIQGPFVAANGTATFVLNYFCNLGVKPTPTPTPYPTSSKHRVNLKVTVTKPTGNSAITSATCDERITDYLIRSCAYHAAAGSQIEPCVNTTILKSETEKSSLLTFTLNTRMTNIKNLTGLQVKFSVRARDSKGQTIAYTDKIPPKFKFTAPPNVTEATLSFDCNLGKGE